MKVRFDFAASLWVRHLDIEAESLEKAREKLNLAINELFTFNDMAASATDMEFGYIADADISDVTEVILEDTYRVKVTNVRYAEDFVLSEDEFEKLVATLPKEFEFVLEDIPEDSIFDEINDKLFDETGLFAQNFDYRILNDEE